MAKFSQCCGVEDEELGVCPKCLDFTGWEEMCHHCDLPALLDGCIVDSEPVTVKFKEVWHMTCVEKFQGP